MNGNASCCVQRGGLIRSHGGGSGGGSGGGVDYTISCSSDGINGMECFFLIENVASKAILAMGELIGVFRE